MREIETDYLVVGAGASGMAFVDTLIAEMDADVVMVDRRHRPGGHWIDAYPFVRLHQPSACYGVGSEKLGRDRIDESGPNAGFYERATSGEICDYYSRVLEGRMLPSGRVRFFGMCDYRGNGSDGHRFVSNLTGEVTKVRVRRKLVDATYTASSVPSKHRPSFEVDAGVRMIPPNDLVNLSEPLSGYTVIGAGKTSMDTCNWLLDHGVDPGSIRWIRPRDVWAMDRSFTQPLDLVASFMEFQANYVEAGAEAESDLDLVHRMEDQGMFLRLDPTVEPEIFRGATLSRPELEALRQIENVVREGKVRRIGLDRITLDEGSIPTDPGQLYIDCTAAGFKPGPPRPIFERDRITMQVVTLGIVPWSAATLGFVEASRDDDEDKNRLCPPIALLGELPDLVEALYIGLRGISTRLSEPDLATWNQNSRLNPVRAVTDHLDDPRVQSAFARLSANMEPAIANLEGLVAKTSASRA